MLHRARRFESASATQAAECSRRRNPVDLLLRLSQLVADFPAVAELDLNPVLALPNRAVAVDARVRVAHPARTQRAKTW